jgi:hypothetical protein
MILLGMLILGLPAGGNPMPGSRFSRSHWRFKLGFRTEGRWSHIIAYYRRQRKITQEKTMMIVGRYELNLVKEACYV